MTDNEEGIKTLYKEIILLSRKCKFNNCTHIHESGCAVLEAIENGIIDRETYNNFKKVEKEQQRFQQTLAEKRKKDKEQGKLYKTIMNEKKSRSNKY